MRRSLMKWCGVAAGCTLFWFTAYLAATDQASPVLLFAVTFCVMVGFDVLFQSTPPVRP